MLSYFEGAWNGDHRVKPRIQILEVRDRNEPDEKPIAWLMLEREETCKRDMDDGSVYEASIRLHYEEILPKHGHRTRGKGSFAGCYSKGVGPAAGSVSITSSTMGQGAIFLDLPGLEGQRIGTYLLNEIVAWAKRWPDAVVNRIELLHGQSHGQNKERRNRFYEQFGVLFDYSDPEKREGTSRPIQVKNLMPVDRWKANILERDALDYVADVLYAEQRVSGELAHRERAIEQFVREEKLAKAKPLAWAVRQLWWRYSAQFAGSVVAAAFIVFLWIKLKGG